MILHCYHRPGFDYFYFEPSRRVSAFVRAPAERKQPILLFEECLYDFLSRGVVRAERPTNWGNFWENTMDSSKRRNVHSSSVSSKRRARHRTARFDLEALENRTHLSVTTYEPIDGVGNNINHPSWGSAGSDLIRLAPAAYADGIDSPALPNDLSARAISNIINNQADPNDSSQDIQTVDQNSLSDFGYSFGQFMDHDMDLSQDGTVSDPIPVAANDPIGAGSGAPLAFDRSQTDPLTGTSTANPAQQTTSITSYFDLSQVYGSDLNTEMALRTGVGGQMKTSPGGLPPLDNTTYFTPTQLTQINAAEGGMADDGPLPESDMFVTGDTRGNENIELTVLQTLFLDNHNLIASQLQKQNPTWSDEQLFQEARKLNIAEYQNIIYTQYLPALLGPNALPAYRGYNPNVNATISNEFSTVAFRFGHSLLSGDVERQGNNGQTVAADVPLEEDFFDPTILNGEGQPSTTDPVTGLQTTDIGAVLKGDADGNAQAMDTQVINEVRDELFNEVIPGVGGGQDLIALDIQRGRDHGIPDYNTLRADLGLPRVTSFAQITSNKQVQQELAQAYPGGVNTIDAFEGGLAEDHVPGSDVGPLFQRIMVNQFTRLRDGDRFFYLNENFTPQELQIMQGENSLTKVIEANTDITNLQPDVFLFRTSISGTVSSQSGPVSSIGLGRSSLSMAGFTVQLEDSSGDVLATTQTDNQGNYVFNQLSGPAADVVNAPGVSATGTYQVVLTLPKGVTASTTSSGDLTISSGDTNLTGIDFVVDLVNPTQPSPVPGPFPGGPWPWWNQNPA